MEIVRSSPGASSSSSSGNDGKGCQCYFNSAEIKKGRWQEDKKVCLQNCRTQFLSRISPDWNDNSGWIEGCVSLHADNSTSFPYKAEPRFLNLYWCDSTFCGVAINPSGGLGQDPNTDTIINTCQNIGVHNIHDPGPVFPADFKCYTEADETDVLCGSLTANNMPGATEPDQTSGSRQTAAISTISSETGSMGVAVWITSTVSSSTPKPAATTTNDTPQVISSSSTLPSSTSDSDSDISSAAVSSTTSSSPLSTPSRIAVGVCTALLLLSLICTALLCLRRRNRRRHSFSSSYQGLHPRPKPFPFFPSFFKKRRPPQNQNNNPNSSPTRLILPSSPTNSTHHNSRTHHSHPPSQILTPPLRLRDRRFLPSILRSSSTGTNSNNNYSPPLTPLTPIYTTTSSHHHPSSLHSFPASPLCTPTTSKLIPRSEKTPRAYTGGLPSVVVQPSNAENPFTAKEHVVIGTPPASPPPNKALPCVPPSSGTKKYSVGGSSSLYSSEGGGEGIGMAVSTATKGKENGSSSNSWGSWGGMGEGGAGEGGGGKRGLDGNGVSPRSSGSSGSLTVTAEQSNNGGRV
ncbi:hypothetical protein QBC38DRAFT_131567 [Podospora fimiseda]|uniref:Uncharacterized protein n=1 Tax=Podospora fimiseda TaxID=252190 RepID=A0AAN7BSW3_9PEZI|nr:hypothetical protein QBC38DRAFT_131567 [Podospora fimiseda]